MKPITNSQFNFAIIATGIVILIGLADSMLVGVLSLLHLGFVKLWFINFLLGSVPYYFLIHYFVKLKKIYPQLLSAENEEITTETNWPPPSPI
jgi:hypothetical protein